MREVIVACLRWGKGFEVDYCNVLHRAVAENLDFPHRFVCVTDDAEGLDPGIEPLPLPEIPVERARWTRGIWPKLGLYAPDLFPKGSVVLFIDLDVMVCGALNSFVDRVRTVGGLHIIREWSPIGARVLPPRLRPYRGSNSSVVGWIAGEQTAIWERFRADPNGALERFRREQDVVDAWAKDRRHWPEGWCASFKRSCVWYPPLNRLFVPQPPREARLLVFHGKPRPKDLMKAPGVRWGSRRKYGKRPVPWVREYWQRYGGAAV